MSEFKQYGFASPAARASWIESLDRDLRLIQARSRRNKRRKRLAKQARLKREASYRGSEP